MMTHHITKPCETLPCSSDFSDTHLAPASFDSHRTPYMIYQIRDNIKMKTKKYVEENDPILDLVLHRLSIKNWIG